MERKRTKRTKLHKTLLFFESKELNRLEKFISSPYFNVNPSISKLYNHYHKRIKNEDKEFNEKEELWQKLFDNNNYKDLKLRKLHSDLLKLIIEFIGQEEFLKNPLHKANYILKSVGEKKLEHLYNSSMSMARRLSERQLEKTASYHYYQYQIEKNLFELTSEFEKREKSKSSLAELNLNQISENLDVFYLAEKLKYYCTLITWKNISNADQDIKFASEVIEQVEKSNYLDYAPIAVYYNIYLSSIHPDNPIHFEKLKAHIDQYIHEFPKKEARDIFDAALNYCIRKMNKGNFEYIEEALNLYKVGLYNHILITNNRISPVSFRNICVCALRLEQYDWIEEFINQYGTFLEDKYRDNAIRFNMARLHWYRKEFQKVIYILQEVDYQDSLYELTSKGLLLSSYYEINEYDTLQFMLSSFNTLLNRNKKKLSEGRIRNYKNLILFVGRLMNVRKGETTVLDKMIEDIKNSGGISDKKWLLEKIEEKR